MPITSYTEAQVAEKGPHPKQKHRPEMGQDRRGFFFGDFLLAMLGYFGGDHRAIR